MWLDRALSSTPEPGAVLPGTGLQVLSRHAAVMCLSHSRAQHYINMPVQFKPKSAGKFEALLVIQTDEGKSIAIRLMGEALGKN